MKAYALTSLSPTPITHSYHSSPNSHILHSLTMEPHLIDWQLETDDQNTTNPNFAPFQHRHRNHHDHVLLLHNYQEYKDEDEDEGEDEDEDEAEDEDEGEDEDEDEEEDGNDLDFTFICRASVSSPVSADEIFLNGQIKPLNPYFNTIVLNHEPAHRVDNNEKVSIRLPLLKLMSQEEDRDFSFASTASSSSSSSWCSSSEVAEEDDNELEGIAPESYCVWRPPNDAKKDSSRRWRCSKSNSTGPTSLSSSSSKRWTLRDMLLNKSLSENNKASKPSCVGHLYW